MDWEEKRLRLQSISVQRQNLYRSLLALIDFSAEKVVDIEDKRKLTEVQQAITMLDEEYSRIASEPED
jgi:nicotinamide riboside kinase